MFPADWFLARMSRRNDIIVRWAVTKIEREYKDDVSLLLMYGSYENGTANPLSDVDLYFIPKTQRAYELSTTFIVEGIGYDLFPMSWERVEGLAELNEHLTPCVGNVKVLYCSSQADRDRFEQLQHTLKVNLANKGFVLNKASERLDSAVELYGKMHFEEDLSRLRTTAGYISMFLADAVAYANHTYFIRGLKKQLEDLGNMKSLPDRFLHLYQSVVKARTDHELRQSCGEMIRTTKAFLADSLRELEVKTTEPDYQALAELYQEIISTWNKIRVACDSEDAVSAYLSGTCLQDELDTVIPENDGRFDLMGAYDAANLGQFKERAALVQKAFVQLIEQGGGSILAYDTVEDFQNKMGE